MPTTILILVVASLVLGGLIAVLTIVMLRLARPADFAARPPASGLVAEQVLPRGFGDFRREAGPEPGVEGQLWRVRYEGLGGEVQMAAVQADSVRGAVQVLIRRRQRQSPRVTIAARLGGDRSFMVMRHPPGRLIGWTNGEWAFIAESADKILLDQFVRTYPY